MSNHTDSNDQQGEALESMWRSDKAREAICEAAEAIANRYCSEEETYSLEVRRLTVAIIKAVDSQESSRASVAAVPNHALVQLLDAALLHPESAEGNIRQVIETLSSTNLELQTVRDENKRLREHVADLNHDLEAAIKECDERHG